MRTYRQAFITTTAILLSLSLAHAATWHVDDITDPSEDGSAEHPFDSIQQAINAASGGDTVIVYPGRYVENINFSGKAITVRSEDPTVWSTVEATVIDGNNAGPAVRFTNGEGTGSKIKGFTITRGLGNDTIETAGGGISCSGSSPEISHNLIMSNNASYHAGGISIYSAAGGLGGQIPIVEKNIITDNDGHWGGGLYYNFGAGAISIANNVFARNTGQSGAGLYIDHPRATFIIKHCTVVSNTAAVNTDGIYFTGQDGTVEVWNTIAWGNGYDVVGCTPYYSDIENFVAGTGNISTNPAFVNVEANDFRLLSASPCIDAGTNVNSSADDVRGTPRPLDGDDDGTATPDMGAYEYYGTFIVAPTGYIAGAVEYYFMSTPGALHQVQYSTNLLTTNWHNLGNAVQGDGGEKAVFDSMRGVQERFYRVISYEP